MKRCKWFLKTAMWLAILVVSMTAVSVLVVYFSSRTATAPDLTIVLTDDGNVLDIPKGFQIVGSIHRTGVSGTQIIASEFVLMHEKTKVVYSVQIEKVCITSSTDKSRISFSKGKIEIGPLEKGFNCFVLDSR